MKDLSSLKKKIAGYSAIASVMLAANHKNAEAQIIYHDINGDINLTSQEPSTVLDLDNDGVYDFRFTYHAVGDNSVGIVQPYNYNEVLCTSSTYIDALSPNQMISGNPGFDYWSFNHKEMFTFHCYGPSCWEVGPWLNATDNYAGIVLNKPDGNHYGWMRLKYDTVFHGITIKDYAYQSQPNVFIQAGEVEIPTGINGVTAPDPFNVFIQDHHLFVSSQQSSISAHLTLLNNVGEKMGEQEIRQPELVMDVSNLATGIYFVVVDAGETRQVKKVVIGK